MNAGALGLLSAAGRQEIEDALAGVLEGSVVSSAVRVSTPTGAVQTDYQTGLSSPETQDDDVSGLLLALSLRQIEASQERYQLGDRRLRVLATRLTTPPTTDSIVMHGEDVYSVLSVERDPLGVQWLLSLRLRA